MSSSAGESVLVFLAGDVMTGRGVDQILAHPSEPELHEPYVESASTYVTLAEDMHGPVPAPVEPDYVWGDGLAVLERMRPNASIVNLETSITVSGQFWPSKGVHYRMHPANVDCLKAGHIDVCVLANNHVLDFGRAGLIETLEVLREAGIASAGAGLDLEHACRPARLRVDDGAGGSVRISVFGFGTTSSGTPREWAAGPSRPGICLLDELSTKAASEVLAHIRAHTGPAELAIASIHWGSNWGYEIEPEQVTFAHRLIDGGVHLVHGHSSHHLRSIEVYRGKLIFYGCGDLVTDYEGIHGHEVWRGELGAMHFAELSTRDGSVLGLRLIPMKMNKLRLTRAGEADTRWLTDTLDRISRPFGARFEQDEHGLHLSSKAG
jgi:poly-gamma-glutamate capsule biosynthesis protein CapA/YwtB (metallophosphatase superfamily)